MSYFNLSSLIGKIIVAFLLAILATGLIDFLIVVGRPIIYMLCDTKVGMYINICEAPEFGVLLFPFELLMLFAWYLFFKKIRFKNT